MIAALDEISAEVAHRDTLFRSVLHEVDLSRIRGKGLHYLPPSDLAGIDGFIDSAAPILQGAWGQLKVGSMVAGLASQMVAGGPPAAGPGSEPPLVSLERYAEALLVSLESARTGAGMMPDVSPWPPLPPSLSTLRDLAGEHLLAKEGRLGFVLLRLAKTEGGFAGASAATDELRQIIAGVAGRHPGIEIGLTGLPLLTADADFGRLASDGLEVEFPG